MDKPFKTIDEQISLLRSRGMAVSDSARETLLREGYYSVINGYKDPFLDRSKGTGDRFVEGTSFEDVHGLFEFDRDLRMILFRSFILAEETLKTVCAYCFSEAHKDEKEPYLNPRNYDSSAEWVPALIKGFETALGRNPGKRPRQKLYLDHYIRCHDEVPLWVLMRCLTLGEAFKFYCFQPEGIRNAIAKAFSKLYAESHEAPVRMTPRRLQLAYDHIKDFRNICAHDERLYCARVSPSKDISLAMMLSDIELVVPKDEYVGLVDSVVSIMLSAASRFSPDVAKAVFAAMGVDSVEKVFRIAE